MFCCEARSRLFLVSFMLCILNDGLILSASNKCAGGVLQDGYCSPCPRGEFFSESRCKKCPKGYYTDDSGETSCKGCAEGKFQEWIGRTSCEYCSPGKYQNLKLQKKCLMCVEGQYQDEWVGTNCKTCPKGYIPLPANVECMECPRGTFSNDSECANCQVGHYYVNETKTCNRCADGQYQNETGKFTCNHCIDGYYADGEISCKMCEMGKYRDAESKSIGCKTCTGGKYSKEGARVCSECTGGQYSDSKSGECSNCSKGYYSDLGQRRCKRCPTGFFQDSKGRNMCHRCPEGTQSKGDPRSCALCEAGTAGRSCSSCNPGQFSDMPGALTCKYCPYGHVQRKSGGLNCEKCKRFSCKPEDAGVWPPHVCDREPNLIKSDCVKNLTWRQSEDCSKGFYLDTRAGMNETARRSWQCIKCPDGVDCSLKFEYINSKRNFEYALPVKEVGVEPGYWNVSWISPMSDLPIVEPCPFPNSCLGKSLWRVVESFDEMRQKFHMSVVYTNMSIRHQVLMDFDYEPKIKLEPGSCSNTTTGVLCAVCKANHYRIDRNDEGCTICEETATRDSSMQLIAIVMVLMIVANVFRKRFAKIKPKHIRLWRIFCRLIVIVFNYMQIGASLPTAIHIAWPTVYIKFLNYLNFANIDLVSMLGLYCLKSEHGVNFWDYRFSIILFCSLILLSSIVTRIMFQCSRSRLLAFVNASEWGRTQEAHSTWIRKITNRALRHLFGRIDRNSLGYINSVGFRRLLVSVNYLGSKRKRKKISNSEISKLMLTLGATSVKRKRETDQNTRDARGKIRKSMLTRLIEVKRMSLVHSSRPKNTVSSTSYEMNLSYTALEEALKSNKLVEMFGYKWAYHEEIAIIRSNYYTILMNLLFLLHAPISQSYFHFFSCHKLGDRYFLRADYSMECYKGKHRDFIPVVIAAIAVFTLGLPIYISTVFFNNRHRLYSPQFFQKYGFLYSNFVKGAELWEVHELARKLMLVGFLLLVPKSHTRAAIATILCILCCCTLNYFAPHKERLLIFVDQASFLLTTCKYLLLLVSHTEAIANSSAESEDRIGHLLLGMDIAFFCTAAIISILICIIILKPSKKKSETKAGKSSCTSEPVKINKKRDSNSTHIHSINFAKILTEKKASDLVNQYESSKTEAFSAIKSKKLLARSRLAVRLAKQKDAANRRLEKGTNSTRNSRHDLTYERNQQGEDKKVQSESRELYSKIDNRNVEGPIIIQKPRSSAL